MQYGRVFLSNEKFLHVGLPKGRIQEAGGGGGGGGKGDTGAPGWL